MSDKKKTPNTGKVSGAKLSSLAAWNTPNNNRVHLSETESWIVKLLLTSPRITFDVERIVCCRYSPDKIQHIRAKGINIITTMVDYTRQIDGKVVKVGEYSIAPDSVDIAIKSVSPMLAGNGGS